MQRFIIREDAFDLEFLTIDKLDTGNDCSFWSEIIGDGYVLQQRLIVPPHLAADAEIYDINSIDKSKANLPLIFTGHGDLPVQYSAVVARLKKDSARSEKNNGAIKIVADGIDFLYSAPVFCLPGTTDHSFFASFRKISTILQEHRMQESAIARTWLFLENILRDYEILNDARKRFFDQWYSPDTSRFIPASTGIQGRVTGNNILSIEFCAFSGRNISMNQIFSPLQNEPTTYDKLFSRAVAVNFPRNKLVFISGTAAIDKAGRSVHLGDFESQMIFTLEVLKALLQEAGGTFSNVAQAIIYLKNSNDLSSCKSILDEVGFPRKKALFMPDVDVCREDLLFEIEATAVMSR